jgi:hypothetical protein
MGGNMILSNIARSNADPKVTKSGPSSLHTADHLARGLGWLSLGLGLAQLLAPGRFSRALGMHGMEPWVRTYGAREIASGVLTLSAEKKLGLWSRVGGDILDIATLVPALEASNPKRENVRLALAAVLGITVLDIVALTSVSARHRREVRPLRDYRDRSGFPSGLESTKKSAHRLESARPRGESTGFERTASGRSFRAPPDV